MKGIALLRKLQPILPQTSLRTIYKSFIRPYLNYGDVIYDQPLHESFSNNIETAHYNTALAITGAIKVDLTINCLKSYDYNIFNKVDG